MAAQTGALAGKLSMGSTSMATGSSWLATSAVVTRAHNDAASARAVFAERMRATSNKLAAAAAAYGSGDSRLGEKLRDLDGPAA